MKILALDQSLQTTGWTIFDNNTLVEFNHFTIQSNRPLDYRLYMIWNKLSDLYNQFEFDKLYFEDIQMQRNNALTYKKLAYVQAAIMLWCYNNNTPYEIYAASHWRKVIKDKFNVTFGKSRQEQKNAAVQFVKQHFEVSPTEDEADAILIGLAAMNNNEDITWGN